MIDLISSYIVLFGSFNPAIFHPEWFERYGILPIQDTQWAKDKKQQFRVENDLENSEEIPPIYMAFQRL